MAFNFHEFPHTSNYDSDLREVICLLRDLEKKVNLEYDDAIKEFLLLHFNSLFADVVYVPETFTLRLYLGVVGDGEHVYVPSEETIHIV